MKSNNTQILSNMHMKVDSGVDLGSLVARQTTGSQLGQDSAIEINSSSKQALTDVIEDQQEMKANAELIEILEVPFKEQNVSMMQKFIHKHEDDL